MALTQVKTGGISDDAVTAGKIPANAVGSSEIADDAVGSVQIADDAVVAAAVADDAVGIAQLSATGTAGNTTFLRGDNSWQVVDTSIADESITLAKLEHGDGTSNGKFLRSNNGADPTWETITTPDADKIIEGDTKVEAVDSGSGGYLEATIDATARQRLHKVGDYGHYELKNSTVLTNSDTIYTSPNGDYIVYVSDTGNDTTGTGTASAPFRTVGKAWRESPVLQGNGNIRIRIADDYTDAAHENFYGKTQAGQGTVIFEGITSLTNTAAHQVVVDKTSNAYNWKFYDVDTNLRFENIKWEGGSSGGGNLCFYRCKYVYIKNSCTWETATQGGWSNQGGLVFDRVKHVDNRMAAIACATGSTAGLGGLVIYVHSRGYHHISVTKTGSKFGNSAVVVKDGSFINGNCSVNNFNTGISLGLNHYGAESAGFYVANGGTIQNCTDGVSLFYGSHWRQYSQSFSSNTTNINNASGGFSG